MLVVPEIPSGSKRRVCGNGLHQPGGPIHSIDSTGTLLSKILELC